MSLSTTQFPSAIVIIITWLVAMDGSYAPDTVSSTP